MSKHFMIVKKDTCEIVTEYFANNKLNNAEFADETTWIHLEIPMEAVVAYLRVNKSKDKFTIFEDLTKKQVYMKAKLQEKMDSVRNQRNAMLADCDWTQVTDAPLTDQQKLSWKKYRQKLRDITTTITRYDQNVIWPTKPT